MICRNLANWICYLSTVITILLLTMVSVRHIYCWQIARLHCFCQNIVRTKKWHTRAECVTDVLTTFLTSSVIYYWADTRHPGIYLFHIIKKQILFQNLSTEHESRPLSNLANTKKSHLTWPIAYINRLLCVEKNCDWFKSSVETNYYYLMRSLRFEISTIVWYLYSFRALFVLHEAVLDNKKIYELLKLL